MAGEAAIGTQRGQERPSLSLAGPGVDCHNACVSQFSRVPRCHAEPVGGCRGGVSDAEALAAYRVIREFLVEHGVIE